MYSTTTLLNNLRQFIQIEAEHQRQALEHQWSKPFAEDMGYHGEPFHWDEERRALLRAELDAYYSRLYGLNRKQLRYILDPADLTPRELEDILNPWEEVADSLNTQGYTRRCGASNFPGETFRVLKERETKQYGEYRTRRLVLEAWDRLEGQNIGNPEGYCVPDSKIEPNPEAISAPPQKPTIQSAALTPVPQVPDTNPSKEETPQPALSDFGLYKCTSCGKMVMGYEKENHERDKHGGKTMEWNKVR